MASNDTYRSIAAPSEGLFKDLGSRFIARAYPVETEAEVKDIVAALRPMGIAALGMNCSFGPASAVPVIRAYAARTSLPLICKPNADCGAEAFAETLAPVLPLVAYAGACCGSSPDYIRAIAERI